MSPRHVTHQTPEVLASTVASFKFGSLKFVFTLVVSASLLVPSMARCKANSIGRQEKPSGSTLVNFLRLCNPKELAMCACRRTTTS